MARQAEVWDGGVLDMMAGDATYIGLQQVDKSLWINRHHVSTVRTLVLPDGGEEVSIYLLGGQVHHVRRSLRDVLACLSGTESYRSQADV